MGKIIKEEKNTTKVNTARKPVVRRKKVPTAADRIKETTLSVEKNNQSVVDEMLQVKKSEKSNVAVSSVSDASTNSAASPAERKSKVFDEVKKKIENKINLFSENAKGKFDFKLLISVAKLMEAGVHNGLKRVQWNPKMRLFIYQKKNQKRQIIDVLKILVFLNRAYNYLFEISKQEGKILFVCTKNDAIKKLIKDNAEKGHYFFMTQRWLGGTLTNYKTVVNSINKLKRLTDLVASPDIEKYSKKEQLLINKKINKLEKFIGGIKNMNGLPHAIVVADPMVEHNAVNEARALNIPVVGIANTNANPNLLDFIVPGNTFTTRSLWLLMSVLIDAILAAKGLEQNVVGKKDEDIILPAIPKIQRNVVANRNFKKRF